MDNGDGDGGGGDDGHRGLRSAIGLEESGGIFVAEPQEFSLVLEKTAKGFGIIFAKDRNTATSLIVDGYVDDDGDGETKADEGGQDDQSQRVCSLSSRLQLGDQLVGVNGADCRSIAVMDIVALLRGAAVGPNTLHFCRSSSSNNESDSNHEVCATPTSGSLRSTVFGALMKVKSKIKAEIDGDEQSQLQEQEENEIFEKKWLMEFDQLRAEYQTKWDTCTYTADEFCGLLFHSSDQQQQAYLVREYPTLMEAWRDADLAASSTRVRPDWPAAKVSYEGVVAYQSRSTEEATNPVLVSHDPAQPMPPAPVLPHSQSIHLAPSLRETLFVLHKEFQWSEMAVHAFSGRLEAAQIYSCQELLASMEQRNGVFFERTFQSRLYPRLTKPLIVRLQTRAKELEQRHESVRDLCMEPLRVNPH